MIHRRPYNAEAPHAALDGDITPTDAALRAQQLRAARPRRHARSRRRGRTGRSRLTLDDLRAMPAVEHAVTLECAGNGRLDTTPLPTGEPWGGYAVSTARWTGRPARRRAGAGAARQPAASRSASRAPTTARTTSTRFSQTVERPDLRPRRCRWRTRADPAAGDPDRLRDERGAAETRPRRAVPADRAALVRGRVGEVAEAASTSSPSRSPASSRPATTCTSGPTARTSRSRSCASAPGSPTRHPARPSRAGTVHGPRQGLVRDGPGHRRSTSASPARASGSPAQLEPPQDPYQWQDWSYAWEATAPGRHSLRARATDAAGNVQPDVPPWNRLGYGNNAIEVMYVDVV